MQQKTSHYHRISIVIDNQNEGASKKNDEKKMRSKLATTTTISNHEKLCVHDEMKIFMRDKSGIKSFINNKNGEVIEMSKENELCSAIERKEREREAEGEKEQEKVQSLSKQQQRQLDEKNNNFSYFRVIALTCSNFNLNLVDFIFSIMTGHQFFF
jgi:hypothetical protein